VDGVGDGDPGIAEVLTDRLVVAGVGEGFGCTGDGATDLLADA